MRKKEQPPLDREELIGRLAEHLPRLRATLHLTQAQLADRIGVSRSTVIYIENRRRQMTWNTFLSLMLVFENNAETEPMLAKLDINTPAFRAFLKNTPPTAARTPMKKRKNK